MRRFNKSMKLDFLALKSYYFDLNTIMNAASSFALCTVLGLRVWLR